MKRIVIVCLVLALLVACQPTPEEDYVVNKSDGVLQERIGDAPVETSHDAPGHLTLDPIDGQHTRILVDADVTVPETTQLPVAEIAQEHITIEWVRRVMEAIADGRTIQMANTEVSDTKPEIVEEIKALQAAIEEWETEFRDKTDPTEWQERRDELQKDLEAWQEAYRTAPDDVGAEADLSEAAFKEQGRLYVSVDFGKKYPAVLEVNYAGCVYFSNWDEEVGHQVYFDVPDGAALRDTAMTKEEAVKLAQAFMERLGETGYTPSVVQGTTIHPRNPDASGEWPPRETWPQAWYVILTRPENGVPAPYYESQQDDFGYYAAVDKVQYIAPINEEYAQFWIRDSGINEFIWQYPSAPIRTVNESVALAPFGQVTETFQKQAALEIWPLAEEYKDYGTVTVAIDRIVLGMSRVRKENDPNIYLMVPTWFFYGRMIVSELNEGLNPLQHDPRVSAAPDGQSYVHEDIECCFMRINAIDGSRIDPQLGY